MRPAFSQNVRRVRNLIVRRLSAKNPIPGITGYESGDRGNEITFIKAKGGKETAIVSEGASGFFTLTLPSQQTISFSARQLREK